jgi:hypothetical protein
MPIAGGALGRGRVARDPESSRRWGVVRLLRPEEEVVDFWPRPELDQLIDWAASDRHIAVQLLAGPGGTGKTRLTRKLSRDVEPMGFCTWWPGAGATMDAAKGTPAAALIGHCGQARSQPDPRTSVRAAAPCQIRRSATRRCASWWRVAA